jgi:hypothetical protein
MLHEQSQSSIRGRFGEPQRTGQAQQGYVATEPSNAARNRLGDDRVDG